MLQNALCSITLAVTGTLVNLHQHIKGVYEDMAGTHAGVDELDIFRIQGSVLFANFRQLRLYLRLLLCFFQIVFPVFFQAAVRVSFHPQTAKAVFHHVTDDPIWGKQLGYSRDFLFGDLTVLCKCSGLRLGIVILVQPADDLHLTTALDVEVILRDIVNQMIDHAILVNNGQAEQQLSVVLCLFKQSRQNLVQGIALFQEQDAEHLVQLVVLLQLENLGLFLRSKGQLCVKRRCDQIRLQLSALGRENPDMGRQIVVDLHETDCNQAVEPCIGNLLDHILICGFVVGILFFLLDDLHQLVTLAHGLAGNRIRFCGANIEELSVTEALRQRLCNAVLRNTNQAGIITNICNQLISRPDRKILYGCLVHGANPPVIYSSMLTIVSSSISFSRFSRNAARYLSTSSLLSSRHDAVLATVLMETFFVVRTLYTGCGSATFSSGFTVSPRFFASSS